MMVQEYIDTYLQETGEILARLDRGAIADAVAILQELRRKGGRLFILGVGGGAGHAGHATNDFRKIAGIETYAPTDNVSELTAWTNDVGWDVTFSKWLEISRISERDAPLIFSVGGGSEHTSPNLVEGMHTAKTVGARIVAVVSRDGGHAAQVADAAVLVPVVESDRITPHAEGWQAIIWHLMVTALVATEEP